MFNYQRRVHFYETDAMGIVHHANYVRFLEEARVAWLGQFSYFKVEKPLEDVNYPVLEVQLEYKNPLEFNDEVIIEVAAQIKGVRLIFDYILHSKSFDKPVAFGKTVHIALCMKTRKPIRLPKEVVDFIAGKEK